MSSMPPLNRGTFNSEAGNTVGDDESVVGGDVVVSEVNGVRLVVDAKSSMNKGGKVVMKGAKGGIGP